MKGTTIRRLRENWYFMYANEHVYYEISSRIFETHELWNILIWPFLAYLVPTHLP